MGGFGRGPLGAVGGLHTQLDAVKVVAIAVRMVITTLRILPQRVLLLNVPIFVRLKITELFALLIKLKQSEYRLQIKAFRVQSTD